jgi:hypothetical protein
MSEDLSTMYASRGRRRGVLAWFVAVMCRSFCWPAMVAEEGGQTQESDILATSIGVGSPPEEAK